MKSYYNLARAVAGCWALGHQAVWNEESDVVQKYSQAIGKLLVLAKKRDKQRTCGSCRFWLHKSSTDKHWGRCTNEKVHESTYITFRDIPNGLPLKIMMLADEACEIRTEESLFGCIHHEGVRS